MYWGFALATVAIAAGLMKDRCTTILEQAYTGAVYDVLRARGYPDQVLPNTIRPLDQRRKVAGPVYTIEGRPTELTPHESLLRWTRMLSKAPPGAVLVCQPHDSTMAHMGELSAETFQLRGVLGYIVDGGARDSELITGLGFPVFCRYTTPRDVVAGWAPTALGEPIEIGGVRIASGDYVLADRDGIVVVPRAISDGVTDEVERVLSTESLVRAAIKAGEDPEAAYLRHRKF